MIERRKPLKRTGLKPPTLEQVRAWQSKPRKAIAKIGPKAKRERRALALFRVQVRDQAGGMCEAQMYGICAHKGIHQGECAHHVWPEDRDCGRHEPARGAWLCWLAHRWVHSEPVAAKKLGLLRPDPKPHAVDVAADPSWLDTITSSGRLDD